MATQQTLQFGDRIVKARGKYDLGLVAIFLGYSRKGTEGPNSYGGREFIYAREDMPLCIGATGLSDDDCWDVVS